MKRLYIIRHAKSSWDDHSLDDHDRPLNDRGKRAAPFMGKVLVKKGVNPDQVITSTALRARNTARLMANEIGYPLERIQEDRDLYMTSPSLIAHKVSKLDQNHSNILLFGHNPTHSDLVHYYTDDPIQLPTAGVACVAFDTDSWNETGASTGQLEWFDYPKNYPEMH